MIKKLLITYLFLITNVFAGLPPTTMRGQSQTLKPTTFNFQVPNKQATITAASTSLIETGNNNELENRGFEHTTVTTGWTVSNATSSSSTTRIEGSKSLSLALTGALSLSQSSTINASQKSGVQMVASIWVNSSDVSDLQLCSLKNGSEDKCTVTGGYVQGSGWRQLTVYFLGDSTSNGLKLKSTDTSGTVLVDQAYVGIGSPGVDFTPDMVYSAKVSGAGAISNENTDWLSSCTIGGSGSASCTYTTGLVNQPMNCEAGFDNANSLNQSISVSSSSSTGFTVQTSAGGAFANLGFYIICQKQGADYKTSKAYVASSSDYGWTSFTPTSPNNSITFTSPNCYHKRDGGDLLIRCNAIIGAGGSSGSTAQMSLPSSLSTSSTLSTSSLVGMRSAGSNTATSFYIMAQPSVGYLTFSNQNGTTNSQTLAPGTVVLDANQQSWYARIPIQGWTDSGVIVGSFQGYNETPGTSRVETFSFSFGTTNINTACSASPCSYLDQIGNNVTNVTKAGGGGDYTVNFAKTFSKIRCTANAINPGVDALLVYGTSGVLSCNNCNSVFIQTVSRSAGTATNGAVTVQCQGIPQ